MPDYGHDLTFGTFVSPDAAPAHRPVDLAVATEHAGLDLVSFQDHPYVSRFQDTWTLMTYVAARTERIHVSGNVLNLPLRPPAVLARAAASLDLLSGGRVELGIGAGGFWDGIAAMGGRKLGAGDSIRALEEAVTIMRGLWDTGRPGGLRFDGEFYQVHGAKRGPAPAHPIPIHIGAYKPRILRLTGRVADGWLPSIQYLPDGLASLTGMNAIIDEAAADAGRDPSAVRRMLNIGGRFAPTGGGFLDGPPELWARQLADVALAEGISTFILMGDEEATIEIFGKEVVPRVRELVEKERAR